MYKAVNLRAYMSRLFGLQVDNYDCVIFIPPSPQPSTHCSLVPEICIVLHTIVLYLSLFLHYQKCLLERNGFFHSHKFIHTIIRFAFSVVYEYDLWILCWVEFHNFGG